MRSRTGTVERRFSAPLPSGSVNRYLTLALDQKQITGWETFMDKFTPAGGALYNWGKGDGWTQFDAHMKTLNQPLHGDCMWWVVHAEVGAGQNLAHRDGRHAAPRGRRCSHRASSTPATSSSVRSDPGGDDRAIQPMTDQELLGPEPAGGAAEQVK